MENTDRVCVQCGSLVEAGSIFCRKCGTALQPPTAMIQPSADDVKTKPMNRTKRIVLDVVKGIAGLAAVVSIFTPLHTGTQVIGFVGAVAVLLICQFLRAKFDDTYIDEHMKDAYWPAKPVDWNSPAEHDPSDRSKNG